MTKQTTGSKRHLLDVEKDEAKQNKIDHDIVCNDFLKWMANEKFNISPKVEIVLKEGSSRYGLYATEEIHEDDVIFTIPRLLL